MQIKISVKAARVNAGLNLVPAAKMIGIGKDKLIKWESPPELIPGIFQKKMAEVYDLPIDCIFFGI